MSARAVQILSRFPAHFEAVRPGKQLGHVVESLSDALEVLAIDLAGVRRSHRLADAETLRDLSLLAGLHGIAPAEFVSTFARAAALRALGRDLEGTLGAPDKSARDALVERIFDALGIAGAAPRLSLLVAPSVAPTADALADAVTRLARALRAVTTSRAVRSAVRVRIGEVCRIHAQGNGTIGAILRASANALDLEIDHERNAKVRAALVKSGSATVDSSRTDEFFHSVDRFLHSTFVRDRFSPSTAEPSLPGADEILGIEENPIHLEPPEPRTPVPRSQRELFTVSRRGFSLSKLRVAITGVENRTLGPQLVNRDEGRGFGFFGAVPKDQALELDEHGRLTLDGNDVTELGYTWRGACFADEVPHVRDFVFDGPGIDPNRRATFAVAIPVDALDRDATFPHVAQPLDGPGIGVGTTRFAFFVEEATLSTIASTFADPFAVRRVTPHFALGFADRSVFASEPTATRPVAAQVVLSWIDHEAYAARVLIPARFASFDTPAQTFAALVAERLARFRPAGVTLRVEYQTDLWTLGDGALPGSEGDPNLRLLGGTVLSAPPVAHS